MADKIQKIVEVKFEGNTAHLEKEAKKLEQHFNSTAGAPRGPRAARAEKAADRATAKKATTEKRTQSQWAKNSKAKMDAALAAFKLEQKTLATAQKVTKETEKQAKINKRSKGVWTKKRSDSVGGGDGLIGKLGGAIGTAIKAATLGVGAMVATHVASGYQAYASTGKAKAGLLGVTKDVGGYDEAVIAGREQAYTAEETTRQAAGVARRTGSIRDVSFAQKVSRAGVGMNVESAAGQMGGMRQAGFSGFGQGGSGRKEFQRMISMGMESGLEAGRMPEFAEGINALVSKQAGAAAGDVSNQGLTALMAKFGQSGLSGFQGARGAAVAQKLDQAIRKPGAGAEGESFMMRAQGFGVQGGNTSYMDARRQMQKGISDPKNLVRMISQAQAEYGAGEGSTRALEELTGLTISQIEGTKSIVASLTEGNLTAEQAEGKLKELANTAKPIEEQVLEATNTGFLDVVQGVADVDERLMAIGEEVWHPLHEAQKKLLDITAKNLPLVTRAVEAMATAAGVGSDVLTGEHSTTGVVTDALEAGASAVEDAASGRVNAQFAANDLANLRSNLEEEDRRAKEGFAGTLGSLADSALVSTMNTLGMGDAQTGDEQRTAALDLLKKQEALVHQQLKAEQARAEIAEMQRQTAALVAETAKRTNESIKNVGSAATNGPSQPTVPGR